MFSFFFYSSSFSLFNSEPLFVVVLLRVQCSLFCFTDNFSSLAFFAASLSPVTHSVYIKKSLLLLLSPPPFSFLCYIYVCSLLFFSSDDYVHLYLSFVL